MASLMPPADTAPAKPAAPADIAQASPSATAVPATGIQAIANAYRDYTKQSLEDAQSFAEKLTAARSLDKAVEAQTEFARQTCETFADNSRKIRTLLSRAVLAVVAVSETGRPDRPALRQVQK